MSIGPVPATKKPAPGPHGNVPPEPASEMYVPLRPVESYPSVQGQARPVESETAPQRGARVATPPNATDPPREPANQPICEPASPIHAAPGAAAAMRACAKSDDFDTSSSSPHQRARQDSNLQPSDSKSPGLVSLAEGPRAPTAQSPAIAPAGAPPAAFPRPSSDTPGYGADKHRGFPIRGAMRC